MESKTTHHPVLTDPRFAELNVSPRSRRHHRAELKVIREELWETHAPEHWQAGRCPHSIASAQKSAQGPWPMNLSPKALPWVLSNTAKLDRMMLLVQESCSRAAAFRRIVHAGDWPLEYEVTGISWHVAQRGSRYSASVALPWVCLGDLTTGESGRHDLMGRSGTWFGRYVGATNPFVRLRSGPEMRDFPGRALRPHADQWTFMTEQLHDVAREANLSDPRNRMPTYITHDVEMLNWLEPLADLWDDLGVVVRGLSDGKIDAWLPDSAVPT